MTQNFKQILCSIIYDKNVPRTKIFTDINNCHSPTEKERHDVFTKYEEHVYQNKQIWFSFPAI